MNSTDKVGFTAIIAKTWRFYGKTPTGEDVANWFELLADVPLAAIATAFQRHLTDTERGQYLPKPADIIRHLKSRHESAHPGPDEAWGMVLRLVNDERETGVLTDEMRTGWQTCQPILDVGDEVGARKCFIETYARCVQDAPPPRWTVSLGTDPILRAQRLNEAVTARRISADHAQLLLPGPAPASLEQVAGLLEGADASEQDRGTAERLRALAQMLRASSAAEEERRIEERQHQRDAEQARRADLLQQLDHHQQRDAA